MMPTPAATMRRPRRSPADLAAAAHRLETLEPRVLLSAFTYQSLADIYDFPGVLHDLTPPEGVETAGFGLAAAALGDIDGDGRADFAIAAPGRAATGEDAAIAGRVFLYSGATGELIRSLGDGFAEFGAAIAPLGDVDGDGVGDLLVGSPLWVGDALPITPTTGAAYIYSGADGSVLRTVGGEDADGELGRAVARIGDLDNDGVPDALIGAPGAGPEGQGRVFAVSGATGAVIYTFTGESAGDRFGAAVHSPGDLPPASNAAGDGVPEIFIGAPGNDDGGEDAGRAYLYEGIDGAMRFTVRGDAAGDLFGTALGSGGSGGGTMLFVGAPGTDVDLLESGMLAADAGEAFRYEVAGLEMPPATRLIGGGAGYRFGTTINTVGDVDGDGLDDLAFGRPGATLTAPVSFRAGGTLEPIEPDEAAAPFLGDRAFAAGDIDADGFADLILPDLAGGRVRIVSSLLIEPVAAVTVGNDALSMLFYTPTINLANEPHRFAAIVDGRAVPLASIAGLTTGDFVVGVNNSGLLVVRPRTPQGPAPAGGYSIIQGGVRSTLADAATSIVGDREPDFDNFRLVKVGNDGSIIFNESLGMNVPGAAWLFKDGVLTFLWIGTVDDVNDAGVALGNPAPVDGVAQTPVLRAPDGTLTQVTGLASGRRLNNLGEVLGALEVLADVTALVLEAPDRGVAIWRSGVVTPLEPMGLPSNAESIRWRIIDFNDAGAALLTAHFLIPGGRNDSLVPRTLEFTIQPDVGLAPLNSLIYGDRVFVDNTFVGPPSRLSESGQVLLRTGILQPLEISELWTLRPGSPVGAAGGSLVATGVNVLGEPVILFNLSGEWAGVAGDLRSFQGEIIDVLSYVDPKDGRTYVFVLTTVHTYWGMLQEDGQIPGFAPLSAAPNTTAIAGRAALFETADGRFHLAGEDASGDLIVFYQTNIFGPGSVLNWSFDNLVDTHLAPRGIPFANIAGNLAAFATPWGSSHIGYLDDAGSVHVVWIAPGGVDWDAVNLSANAGAAPLMGELTSLVTPWQTLHFNATDQDGAITAVWWAPGFEGQWRADAFAPAGSARLEPGSLTSFVTPWSALHVMGRDAETGEPVALWWAPATQEWRSERLQIEGEPEGLVLTGPTASSVTGGDTLNLFARQDDGHLARIFWTVGDGSIWSYENVTSLAMIAI